MHRPLCWFDMLWVVLNVSLLEGWAHEGELLQERSQTQKYLDHMSITCILCKFLKLSWIRSTNYCKIHVIMPPTSKKLTGHIGFGLCVRPCVRACVLSSKTVYAWVLKFHTWIPRGKIFDARLFSCPSYLPSGVTPI